MRQYDVKIYPDYYSYHQYRMDCKQVVAVIDTGYYSETLHGYLVEVHIATYNIAGKMNPNEYSLEYFIRKEQPNCEAIADVSLLAGSLVWESTGCTYALKKFTLDWDLTPPGTSDFKFQYTECVALM